MSDEIRIGVFVCDCGSNIAGVVNVPEVVEYARGLKDVAYVDEGRWSCSVDALGSMQEAIKEHGLTRVVIAACTPRTHEPLFKRCVKEAGLNPYLLEFVSIREQSSWVHMDEPEKATEKAMDLVKMAVAKAALLEEGEEIRLPVKKDCMIIGGGMSGMTAALNVADQGFNAVIVEKEPQLGGLLNRISTVVHDTEEYIAADVVKRKQGLCEENPNIRVYTGAGIEEVEGYIGNYKVSLRANGTSHSHDISTIIVATGMKEIAPDEGQFEYGKDPRVVTQLELEEILKRMRNAEGGMRREKFEIRNSKFEIKEEGIWFPDSDKQIKDVVIINCVNSKNETRGCCAIGCPVSVKNALAIKEFNRDIRVSILYRDLSMIKDEQIHLQAAKEAGVKFIRFPEDQYPEVTKGESLTVKVRDILLGTDLELSCDLLALTVGFQGDDTVDTIKGQLKVSGNRDGFFQEAHIKLGPLDFPSDGISLCGCAKNPKTLKESCEEGMGAAMRVSIPMNRGYIEAEGIVADIDLTDCSKCTLCHKKCPYSAIQINEEKEPFVIKALCKGCGLCAADCPEECISIVHYSDEQLLAQVEAALEENPQEKILGFVCHWCALGGVDMAGVSRLQYPTNGRLIRVMCSARVPISLIERAYELGAAGVLVAGCEFPTCHYITGNYACETRMKRAKKRLAKKGYDPEKLWNIWCSAADGPKFANSMRDMAKELGLA